MRNVCRMENWAWTCRKIAQIPASITPLKEASSHEVRRHVAGSSFVNQAIPMSYLKAFAPGSPDCARDEE